MWRRSPLWMVTKDLLHVKFVNASASSNAGNLEYKCFMLQFFCKIVSDRVKVCLLNHYLSYSKYRLPAHMFILDILRRAVQKFRNEWNFLNLSSKMVLVRTIFECRNNQFKSRCHLESHEHLRRLAEHYPRY